MSLARASRVVCLGDVMVDVLAPLPGPLVIGSDVPAEISFAPGGSAANTAAWLADLGVPVLFVGRVGDDEFGRAAVRQLARHGVATRVSVDPNAATGVCLVLVSPDGERTMVPSAGANGTLSDADLSEPPLLQDGDWLHVSGYALFNAGSRNAAQSALARAGELGLRVSVDAASAAPIQQVGGTKLLDWLPFGTLVFANADELAALTADDPAGSGALTRRGFAVLVKHGSQGAEVADHEGVRLLPTPAVAAVDSTGAGDAFAAGALSVLIAGGSLDAAAERGNEVGARALSQLGGRPVP